MQSAVEQVGQRPGDVTLDLPRVVARAEVRGDDELVLESLAALDDVVEVHMAELVDPLFAMAR